MMRRTWMCLVVLSMVLSVWCGCAQEEVTVTGRVVGPDGEGIAGADVWWRYRGVEGREWISVKTNADGGFELVYTSKLARKYCTALVAVEGYALTFIRPGDGPLEIKLSREMGSISGTVVDPDGEPLTGVDVRVRLLQEPGSGFGSSAFLRDWDGAPGALTDEQGHFSIGALPPGYQIALAAERVGLANYYDSWSADWPVTGDEVRIVMSPEALISGRVTCDGEPVADVYVGAQVNDSVERRRGDGGGGGHATTGDDGRYRITGVSASTFNVAIIPPEGYTSVAHEALQVMAGDSAEGIDFELIEGVMLRGVVTWADTGELVSEAAVAAYGPAHPKSSAWCQPTKTDADGRYELRLPPGQNYIYWQGVPSEAWYAEPKNVSVEIEEGMDQTVDFRLFRKPTITLTVLNPDGTPAAGVAVNWGGEMYGASALGVEPLTTNARGEIELAFGRRHGHEHNPVAAALAQDTERDLAGLAIISAERNREATITLQQAAWIVASVEDREGKPLPDIDISAWAGRASVFPSVLLDISAKTDADGQARLGPLPSGVPLTVGGAHEIASKAVSSPDEAREPVVLEPGETLIIEPYVLMPEGYSLRGTVVDAEGDPVEGALVIAGQTPELQTKTDAEGRFELEGLSVRRRAAVIAALPDGSAAYAEPVDASVAFEPTIQLAASVTIVATVLDDDGKPVVAATARIHSDGPLTGGLPGELKTYAEDLRTDERGQFRAEGLIAGLEYGVMAYTGDDTDPGEMWGDQILVLGGEGVIEMTLTKRR